MRCAQGSSYPYRSPRNGIPVLALQGHQCTEDPTTHNESIDTNHLYPKVALDSLWSSSTQRTLCCFAPPELRRLCSGPNPLRLLKSSRNSHLCLLRGGKTLYRNPYIVVCLTPWEFDTSSDRDTSDSRAPHIQTCRRHGTLGDTPSSIVPANARDSPFEWTVSSSKTPFSLLPAIRQQIVPRGTILKPLSY